MGLGCAADSGIGAIGRSIARPSLMTLTGEMPSSRLPIELSGGPVVKDDYLIDFSCLVESHVQ